MIIIPAILQNLRTLSDKTFKLTFDTNEPTPEQIVAISTSIQTFGYLAFKTETFKEREKEAIAALETSYEDNAKTHSKRLRNTLYRLWEHENNGFKDFDSFYKYKMDEIIKHLQSKLP